MSIKSKLKVLISITLVGLGLIMFITVSGLNAIKDTQATSHRMKGQVIEALEIKASAISTIMLDPTLQETKDVFTAAERNIDQHGDAALKTIRRPEVQEQLKQILAQWKQYDLDSQQLIKLAANDAKTANEQLVPLYNREFKPLQAALEKFVIQLQQDASQAAEQADTVSSQTYWQEVVLLVLVTLINGYVVFSLSSGLRSGLLRIQQKLVPLKEGDLTQRFPIDTKDELSEIGIGVNAFIEELQGIVERTRSNADAVANAAVQLASSSEQVLASSNHQSEATSSVAAAVEQFSVSIDHVSDNAGDAEQKATMSGDLSRQGSQEVQSAVAEMQRIEQAVNRAVQQMEQLDQQAQEISGIVNVIKEVAEQTNLLALNAAIEAARAGDMGRGFAVVADEVRKLAERTTGSAQEITETINSMQGHTAEAAEVMKQGNALVKVGVKQAEQAGNSMHQINDSSEGVMHAVSDISSALREQRMASTEIAKNVERIAQMTEENSAAISQVAAAADGLRSLAGDLQQGVARFKV